MNKNVRLLLITFVLFCMLSFMSFASNVVVPVIVPDGTELERINYQSVIPNMIACGGGSTINPEDEEYDPENPMPEEVEETYTMPQTTARYTSDEDPLFVVEVDGEGGTKHIHLPYPDATIDYDKVDYKKAKYHY